MDSHYPIVGAGGIVGVVWIEGPAVEGVGDPVGVIVSRLCPQQVLGERRTEGKCGE